MRKNNFINEKDIIEQWGVWKNSAKNVEDRKVPDKLIEQMYVISSHLLEHQRFVRYPHYEKQDMMQEGVLKCMKNLKNYDPTKGKIFSYFTRCCWTAFIVYLAKYYDDLNEKRELLMEAIDSIDPNSGIQKSAYLQQMVEEIAEQLAQDKSEE